MLAKFISCFLLLALSCKEKDLSVTVENQKENKNLVYDNPYSSISSVPLPKGYQRQAYPDSSFTAWLREVHLKKDKTVYKFDGSPKVNQEAQFAVLDISVGNEDLQQCADAVMRLRAEYLYSSGNFSQIVFTDNDGKAYCFTQPYTRMHFDNYLRQVFGMCGSASLSKQLTQHVEMQNIQPGDVLIHGGFPGHAVIVTDVAINKQGKKIYLLAQSYMPAQDIHILKNYSDPYLSPWYEVNDQTVIQTPEYRFTKYELKRW